ncbi:MAG: heme o synthase [Planctomycetota bacterium]|nr:heme o synthase [Planctomycetota bacterium]
MTQATGTDPAIGGAAGDLPTVPDLAVAPAIDPVLGSVSGHASPLAAAAAPEAGDAADRGFLSDLNQLTKPRITLMVVITAYIGYELGLQALAKGGPQALAWAGRQPTSATMWLMLLGTALSCMGAGVFNQILERDTDALMNRTKKRPLPAGRVAIGPVFAMGLAMSVAGIAILAVYANALTAGLSAFTILSYALIYTPLKRVSSVCTIVGAVPGAMPPVMGYAAATGTFSAIALVLFAILFIWQLPHFLAIAWLYKDDYARAGLPMLPVIDPDGSATCRQILASCLALLPLGLLPTLMGVCGLVYLAGALVAGLVFLGFGVALVRGRTRAHARALFFASLIYLPLVYGLMLLDRT